MARPLLFRVLLAMIVLGTSIWYVVEREPRLGLDLRGGTQIVLETSDSPTTKANAESTQRTVEVLRRRVDALGVAESNLARSGERRIIVELPDVQDPRKAEEVIGKTAQLTFHPVLGVAEETEPGKLPPAAEGETVVRSEFGQPLRLGPAALTGDDVSDATPQVDQQLGNEWQVAISFRGNGGAKWATLTGKAACAPQGDPQRQVAILLDENVISSPQMAAEVACGRGISGGQTVVTGDFNAESARDLAVLIEGGSLPVPVKIIEKRTVGPTLGADAIAASGQAAIIGVTLTGLFIIFIYRMFGFLATVALACYGLISYAALIALGATLTLPGLAGFVLAIGMAVDANVLVFERAREDFAGGEKLRKAAVSGFNRAWTAIIDSNITTLIAAGLLFYLASGPVRGFGVTLSIGVLASMVSALIITRVLVELYVRIKPLENKPKLSGVGDLGRIRQWLTQRDPDLMGRRRLWLTVSAVALVLALSGLFIRGLDLGVEFTGGRLVSYTTTAPIDADRARVAVSEAGLDRAVVQLADEGAVAVRGSIDNDQVQRIRAELSEAGAGEVTVLTDELIGPSLGNELRRNAIIALIVALATQMLYLAVRFRWTFGAATVLAMAHDVLILIGIFAWLGKPIDGVFLAALLTVIGYSVNDSVVIFDRIREIWRGDRKTPLPRIVNTALLQTVPRTINTGLGAVFILAALALLGGRSLTDFALALLIGIGVGSYSSLFTAAPLAIELERFSNTPPPAGPKKQAAGTFGASGERRDTSGAVV